VRLLSADTRTGSLRPVARDPNGRSLLVDHVTDRSVARTDLVGGVRAAGLAPVAARADRSTGRCARRREPRDEDGCFLGVHARSSGLAQALEDASALRAKATCRNLGDHHLQHALAATILAPSAVRGTT
jgi:hypothetical protein